jgi:hypothetical protein
VWLAGHRQPQLVLREIKSGETNRDLGTLILEKLSDGEKKRLQERLGIPISPDTFKVLSVAPLEDDLAGLKSFNGDERRRFWLYPKKIVKP